MVINTVKGDSTYMGYEYVDLGLPSGLLWATRNVGATSDTDFGNYYMWKTGDVTYQDAYDQELLNLEGFTYVDTATAVMGGAWRMPTRDESAELVNNTTIQYVLNYNNSGVRGAVLTGQNSNSIFIPGAGSYEDGQYKNSGQCLLWTATNYNNGNAFDRTFNTNGANWSLLQSKLRGKSVRGVVSSNNFNKELLNVVLDSNSADKVYIGDKLIFLKLESLS